MSDLINPTRRRFGKLGLGALAGLAVTGTASIIPVRNLMALPQRREIVKPIDCSKPLLNKYGDFCRINESVAADTYSTITDNGDGTYTYSHSDGTRVVFPGVLDQPNVKFFIKGGQHFIRLDDKVFKEIKFHDFA